MDEELKRMLVRTRVRIGAKGPFFRVLLAHMKLEEMPESWPMQTAAVDGYSLFVSKPFWMGLSPSQQEFVMIHEVLHVALGHVWRRGSRNPLKWNMAADYVVNLTAKRAGYQPIPGALISDKFDEMTVDEVYALIPDSGVSSFLPSMADILEAKDPSGKLAAKWRAALSQAQVADELYGTQSLGQKLKIVVEDPSLNWRQYVWNTLTAQSNDFTGLDRRLVSDELYVEDLDELEEPEKCAICIDTSGSTMSVLGKFIGEVRSLASLYALDPPIYFEDVELVGPIPLSEVDQPIGGGGTSFVKFFEEAKKQKYSKLVYFTDLCGEFPKEIPDAEVLWVVPPGTTEKPPFGRVVKITD